MKKIIAFLLACLMIVPAFAGCAANKPNDEILSNDEALSLNVTERAREITAYPIEKAYVRGGSDWSNKNWRDIIKERGINQNNAEPLVIKHQSDLNFMRMVYFTFDISNFATIPYNNAFLKVSFTQLNKAGFTYNVHKVNPDSWNTDTITWNNKPSTGALLAENCVAGGLTTVDLTDAVDAAIKAGEKKLSIVLTPNGQSGDGENRIDWRGTTLTATTATTASTYVKNLVADPAENQAIWDWAQKLYDEWYARYNQLIAEGKPEVDLIPVDEKEYAKQVLTTGTGVTSASGIETRKWTDSDFKKWEPTRTMDSLIGLGEYSDFTKEQKFDEYGGLIDNTLRQEVTGFFYTTKIGDRWWVIDPLGYPCYIRAVSGVGINYLSSPNQKAAAIKKYGTEEKWDLRQSRFPKA